MSFFTLLLITRFFSPDDIGKLTMLQATSSFIIMLMSLSMHQAFVREYVESTDKSALLKTAGLPSFFLFLASILPIVFFSQEISFFLFAESHSGFTNLLLIAVGSGLIIHFLMYLLRMEERGIAYSLTRLLPKTGLFLIVSCVIYFQFTNTKWLLQSYTFGVLISAVLFLFLSRKSILLAVKSRFDSNLFKTLTAYSLPLLISDIAYWALLTSDRFFLRWLADFSELGFYGIAVSFTGIGFVLTSIFSNLWHPTVYKWVKENEQTESFLSVMNQILLIVALLWSLAGLSLHWFLKLLPETYAYTESLIMLSLSVPLFYLISETTVIGTYIVKKSKYTMWASVAAFSLNAILNWLTIPSFGAKGAALASAIAFFIFLIIRTESSVRVWHLFKRSSLYVLSTLYLSAGIAISFYDVNYWINASIWIGLAVLALILKRDEARLVFQTIKEKLL
ncbi:hypothetical protein EP331_04355 [bacterium]|nr:MAG: hypothetical protein EP331_04355 [bacterium]